MTVIGILVVYTITCAAEYKGKLYVGGRNSSAGLIMSVASDGTTLSSANTLDSTSTASEYEVGCTGMAVLSNTLYFVNQGYATGPTDYFCKIGSYDNSTWTDSDKDFKAQFTSTAAKGLLIGAMAAYRGELFVGICQSIGLTVAPYLMYKTQNGGVTGTWIPGSTNVAGTNSVYYMVQF